ncbi:MAG: hypothetical protein ACI32H_02485, partial [Bacilli bacterium]
MKRKTKYLDMATRLLTEIYKDDLPTVASVICAQADEDYETVYKHLKSMKDEIESIEYKLKQEG